MLTGAVLLLVVAAEYQRYLPTPPSAMFDSTVERCIKQVHKEVGSEQFDAYVEGTLVRYIGTAEERFKFDKCLSKNGVSITPGARSRGR